MVMSSQMGQQVRNGEGKIQNSENSDNRQSNNSQAQSKPNPQMQVNNGNIAKEPENTETS